MRCSTTIWYLIGALLVTGWARGGEVVLATGRSQAAANKNSAILADFKARVDAYAALHRKQDESLPKLRQEATPAEIDLHQRSLLTRISAARGAAKQGDVFTPPIRGLIRALIADTFARGNSATLRESIQDENPGKVSITVNGQYPEELPLASMPAQLLKNLPPLPPVVEYRFVGDSLILLDSGAHLIVDLIPNALPR